MIHLGDITKLNGANIPVVDCIIGGSPCQDLSVAGKRAGLDGERSGLFMDQIRIVKEMRENDKRNGRSNEFIRPRFMVWENVPGAFSANNGEDFRAVLEETARIADRDAVIPRPEGGWRNAGVIMGDGWSVAWRVHDAQFWGVAQRRRRIALVADFGGQSAPEILFECKGMSRDIKTGETKGEGIAGTTEVCIDSTICIEGNGSRPSHQGKGWDVSGKSYTLNTIDRHAVFADMYNHSITGNVASTINATSCNSPGHSGQTIIENVAYKCDGSRGGDIAFAITGDHDNRVTDMTNITIEKQ